MRDCLRKNQKFRWIDSQVGKVNQQKTRHFVMTYRGGLCWWSSTCVTDCEWPTQLIYVPSFLKIIFQQIYHKILDSHPYNLQAKLFVRGVCFY